ncbi:MAG: hypothetical protein K0U41_06910 [Gammaproteobacteria bacterium]|nr:hypothetical protein [Gammaproteobacteria bacterium]
MVGYGLDEQMFNTQKIDYHSFDGNKDGSPKDHNFRLLPPFAPGKIYHKVRLHWGYRSADGKMKALQCSYAQTGTCPICDHIKSLQGDLENIDASLKVEADMARRSSLEALRKEKDEYIRDHRAKPTYLWNVLSSDDKQKVLRLSWNGHDPLHEKVKFIFSQLKTDVTSLSNNMLMYCNRSGLGAKTRYTYEKLDGHPRDLTQLVTSLTDLTKVYQERTPEFLQIVLDTDEVPPNSENPNDRNFNTAQSAVKTDVAQPAAQPVAQPVAQPIAQPVAQPVVVQPPVVQPTAQPVIQQETSQAPSIEEKPLELSEDQDASVKEMLAALGK